MKSLVSGVQEVNARLSTDDAPLWAEVLGVTLALGFFVRDYAHVLTALVAGAEPQLRGQDVTTLSPVESLENTPKTDISARVLAVSFGLVVVFVATLSERRVVTAYLIANALVPLTDPVLFVSIYK